MKTIHIVTPGTIKQLCFDGSTIADLRSAIATLLHVDPASLRLVYNGAALDDRMGACPVGDGGAAINIIRDTHTQLHLWLPQTASLLPRLRPSAPLSCTPMLPLPMPMTSPFSLTGENTRAL